MLLKEYRGKGIGYQLYTKFEEVVKQKQHYKKMALVEIVRQDLDPRKPKNYVSGPTFWQRLGFVNCSEMIVELAYKEIDSIEKKSHCLVYSIKSF